MTPKYYTPVLAEFHDQFEYEEKQFIWKKKVFDFRDLEIIHDELLEDKLRVKHLDREDIQECGWELRTDDNKDIHNTEYTIETWYFKTYPNGFCTIYDDTAVDKFCFRGTIKNKSELKKLMVQLGIN